MARWVWPRRTGEGSCTSSVVQNTILEHLTGIANSLSRSLLASIEFTSTEVQNLEKLTEEANLIISCERSSDEESDNHLLSDDDADTKTTNKFRKIQHHIGLLMKLLPSLNHLLEYVRQEKDVAKEIRFGFVGSKAAFAYINAVREKFRAADNELTERLGEANWQRHIRIRGKLQGTEQQEIQDEQIPIAKSLFRPISTFQDSGLGISISTPTIAIEPSVASHSSYHTNATEKGSGVLRVPETPKEVHLGVPFTCDICQKTLTKIKNRYQWKIHVFADLEAYICTFPGCEFSLATFPTRDLWAAHEFSTHRTAKVWICSNCSLTFPGPDKLADHLQSEHEPATPEADLQLTLLAAERMRDTECPLCLKNTKGKRRDFVAHVAKHMETTALMALPKDSESDVDSDSITQVTSDEEVEENSTLESKANDNPHYRSDEEYLTTEFSSDPMNPANMAPHKKHLDTSGDTVVDLYGQTPLTLACWNGKLESARQRLAECPEHVNWRNLVGNTPLQVASLQGHVKIVKLLIEAGAVLDTYNDATDTPLLDAVDNGHLEVIRLLLDAGANPRKANVNGEEPLDRVNDDLDHADEIRELIIAAKQRNIDLISGEHAQVRYDDSLTEGQWVNAVDDDDDTPEAAWKERGQRDRLERLGQFPPSAEPSAARSPESAGEPASTPLRKRGRPSGSDSLEYSHAGEYASNNTSTLSTDQSDSTPVSTGIDRMGIDGITNPQVGSFQCTYPGCTAPTFQTQYLLNSHTNIHSTTRPWYCSVKGCRSGEGGSGFVTKFDLMRHALAHDPPGYYVCPFCPDRERIFPRPDNLQRHVEVHHTDKDNDDPQLRDALSIKPKHKKKA
ncbi:hypothetical protein B7463_g10453, partial [Scytalidium lignicola]